MQGLQVRAPNEAPGSHKKCPAVLRPSGFTPHLSSFQNWGPLRSRQQVIMLKLLSPAQQVERVRPVGHLRVRQGWFADVGRARMTGTPVRARALTNGRMCDNREGPRAK